MIALELLELIPDDDPAYDQFYRACLREGLHPAHAALQAHYDHRYTTAHAHQRKDAA